MQKTKLIIAILLTTVFQNLNAQISTSTGGATNVLANNPTTNTNVGIGTDNPTSKLEVIGDVKAIRGIFNSNQANGQTYTSNAVKNDQSIAFSAGSIIGSGPGYINTRMLNFFDFPGPNAGSNTGATAFFNIVDRNDMDRFRMFATADKDATFLMYNKRQEDVLKVYEDGADNVFLQMGKPNSKVTIGGYGDNPKALNNKLFVAAGNARVDGNLVADSKIGIGVSDPKFNLDIEGSGTTVQNFSNTSERASKSLILNAGTVVDGTTGRRMLTFIDFPQSNLDNKAWSYFAIEDRNDSNRFRHWAQTGNASQLELNDKEQKNVFSIYEDGTNTFLNMPKPDSYISIGGKPVWPIAHKFWVVSGTSKFNNDVFVDTHIGIGTDKFIDVQDNNKEYKLSVKGRIRAEEVKVYNTWADYVFAKDYTLKPLSEVETFIKENNHLPNVPSAKEVTEKGLELGEMVKIQQEKIEELTLYLIQQNKEIQKLKEQNERINALEAKFNLLISK